MKIKNFMFRIGLNEEDCNTKTNQTTQFEKFLLIRHMKNILVV